MRHCSNLIAALLLSALTAGCDRVPGTTANLKRLAHEVLSQTLFDPASADYRDLHYGENDKGIDQDVICGEANAKNRLGGYTGFKGFFVFTDKRIALIDPGVNKASSYISDEDREAQVLFDLGYPAACKRKKA